MHTYKVEGVSVTDKAVHLSGVWLLGGAKRFQMIHVPLGLFTDDSVLEALNSAHSGHGYSPAPVEDALPLAW